MAVGIYTRISDDAGDALGVARQEKDCRALSALRGWDVGDVYVDNDISAFKRNVVRPEFERLLDALEAGDLDGVIAYDLDRFARKPTDLERAIALYDARPGMVFATVQGDLDLASADGRTMARVLVAFANKSSMDTARRVKRKHAEIREAGGNVGGPRPFGWQDDKVRLHEREAALLREAARTVLAGGTMLGVVRSWNARGVPTVRGRSWSLPALRLCLTSPRIAGYRVHGRTVARHLDGTPIRGVWESILTVDEWESICALSRPTLGERPGSRKFLLSGTLICGVCFSRLAGTKVATWKSHRYRCYVGHVTAQGPACDEYVEAFIREWIEHVAGAVQPAVWVGAGKLEAAETQRAELMAAYQSGQLPADVVFPAVSALSRDIEVLVTDRAAVRAQTAVVPSSVAWEARTLDEKRAEIRRLVSGFVVKPAAVPRAHWSNERLVPLWHPRFAAADGLAPDLPA